MRNTILLLINLWLVYMIFYLYYDMLHEIYSKHLPVETRWIIGLLAFSIVGFVFIYLFRSPEFVIVLSLVTAATIGSFLYLLGGLRTGYEPRKEAEYYLKSLVFVLSTGISLMYALLSEKLGLQMQFVLGFLSQTIICVETYRAFNSLSKMYRFASSLAQSYPKNPVQKLCENPVLALGLAFLIVVASPYLSPVVGIMLNFIGIISWILGVAFVGRERYLPTIILTLVTIAETF